MTSVTLHPMLEASPHGLLVLDRQDRICAANESARLLGFATGRPAETYFDGLKEPFVDAVRFQAVSSIFQMKHQARQKRFTVTCREHEGLWYCWLNDLSETLVLAEQVNRLKQPETKLLRHLQQAAVSGMGYSELVDVILDDSESLPQDKMATVTQYHREVTGALTRILELLKGEKRTLAAGHADKLVVVADSHEALAELITELLRTEGYKVASFTDAGSTLTYCNMNAAGIGQALIDENMTDGDGRRIIDVLAESGLRVIRLSEHADDSQSVQKPVDFRQLLEVLEGD